ncbi:hypothetical protein CONPUDRAFT_138628 [Coniophora puteana RWD-64-598 SS2]|uniref:Transcription activator of gluconeogenesis ERT1 n=1 Tax=Coniophora puteana (strain RWD-64-598) TaxID=741705 RepID=A0A5M3MGV1_CONPW|nr:uncharacterized protein CONPUDRAFT_138628 [Coniophora puteana RWD-64-598 SS2]EIW78287.1 hypothetical protein CONPUDRAFT_138628 [Coniophora puteana RWD-64-598 SS2]
MTSEQPKPNVPPVQEHPYPGMPPYPPYGTAYPPPGYPVYYPPPPDPNHADSNNGAPPSHPYMFPFPAGPGMIYPYPPPPGQGFPPFAQPPPNGANGVKPKRKQVKMACTNCASACKRCDEGRPCERCIKYGMADSCIDGIRKERQKGIKRGPYKRKNKNASPEDTSHMSNPDWQANGSSASPTTPAGAPMHPMSHFPPPPEGFYPYFYPPPGMMPPGHDGQPAPGPPPDGSPANGQPPGPAAQMVPYYPMAPGYYPYGPPGYPPVPGAPPPGSAPPVQTMDPSEATNGHAQGEGNGNGNGNGKKRGRPSNAKEDKSKKTKTTDTTSNTDQGEDASSTRSDGTSVETDA